MLQAELQCFVSFLNSLQHYNQGLLKSNIVNLLGEASSLTMPFLCGAPHLLTEGICVACALTQIHKDSHESQHTDFDVPASCTQMVSHMLRAPHNSEGGTNQGCSLTPSHSLDTILLVVTNFNDEAS
jgi:hypothetical protein